MIRIVNILSIGLWIWAVCSSSKAQELGPKVQVAQGELLGRYVSSQATGQDFYSFQGVPYAKPPLDELRFRDAVPPEPWDGTYDATKTASECVQLKDSKYPTGSEDCLYLNVYTPQLPSAQSSPLPVMFWIPGGAFSTGSGSDDVYGPDYFVEQGVVLVTINYRLSVFGFLYMKNAAPGNAGLKDQLCALRWVNENIASFNGDPKQISVFGESAGAVSAHWFTLTPLTRGLFQRAIAESGSALSPWAVMVKPYDTSKNLAKDVGCTTGSDKKIVECLRKVNSDDLIKSAMIKLPSESDRLLPFIFVPTTEEKSAWGVEQFVTAPPVQLIKNGCQQDVPFLTGFNDAEWMLDILANRSLFSSEESLKKLDSDWNKYILPETRLPTSLSNRLTAQALGELKKFYLGGKALSFDNLQGYKNMLTDLQIGEGIMYGAKYKAKAKKTPVYVYNFTVDDQLNYLKHKFSLTSPGAAHDDEIGYLFNVKSLPTVPADSPAGLVRRRMVQMWTNFAKDKRPIPKKDNLLNAKWKPYDESNRAYLEIGADLKEGSNFFKKTGQFYEKFYKNYGENGDKNTICGPCAGLLSYMTLCLFS